MIRAILLTGIFVLLAASAFGEYYQYTDQSGTVRFTDNLAEVPENQRSGVTAHESVKSVPVDEPGMVSGSDAGDTEASSIDNEEKASVEPTAEDTGVENDDTGKETIEITATELNRLQAELNQTREALEQEKMSLEEQAPNEKAKNNEKIAYSMQVDALNAKIKQYENDIKAFDEKVAAFNDRKKKKTE